MEVNLQSLKYACTETLKKGHPHSEVSSGVAITVLAHNTVRVWQTSETVLFFAKLVL